MGQGIGSIRAALLPDKRLGAFARAELHCLFFPDFLNAALTSSSSNAAPPIHPGFGTLFVSVIASFPFCLRYLLRCPKEKWMRRHVPVRLVLVRLTHEVSHPLLD